MKKLCKVLLILLLIAATAGVTFMVTVSELGGGSWSRAASKTEEIESLIEYYFIDDYDEERLADGAAAGMIAATGDEWSYYISAEDYDAYQEQSENAYVGIGVTIELDEEAGGFTVTSVTPGGPAAEGGVLPGDLLTCVDGESAIDIGQSELVRRVRGEAGTTVELTLERGGEPYSVTLTRKSIETEVATLEWADGQIAVITIDNFDAHCAEQSIAAIDEAVDTGAKGLVFDVRNNPGGYKDELVEVLDRLLPEGVLFRSLDYAGEEEEDMSDEVFVDLPMAVLVNEDSYSAAEFFAAALQEYEAAEIVGTKTYGKGNFQSTFRLSDGSAVAISIGKYFTPNGVSLTGTGVEPDVEIDLSDEEYEALYRGTLAPEDDPQLQAAIEAVRAQ